MDGKFCVECGARISIDARFCRACGRPQPQVKMPTDFAGAPAVPTAAQTAPAEPVQKAEESAEAVETKVESRTGDAALGIVCGEAEITMSQAGARQILDALQTVKIGGRSARHTGASDRRIYDFLYIDSGECLSFEFFADTFYWKGVSYDVLDWGDLKK